MLAICYISSYNKTQILSKHQLFYPTQSPRPETHSRSSSIVKWVLQVTDVLYNWLCWLCVYTKWYAKWYPSHSAHVGILIIESGAWHKANPNVNGTTPPSWEWLTLHAFFMLNDECRCTRLPFCSFANMPSVSSPHIISTGRKERCGKVNYSGQKTPECFKIFFDQASRVEKHFIDVPWDTVTGHQ